MANLNNRNGNSDALGLVETKGLIATIASASMEESMSSVTTLMP